MDCIAEIFHLIYRFCNQVGQCIIERNTMAFGVFVKLRDIHTESCTVKWMIHSRKKLNNSARDQTNLSIYFITTPPENIYYIIKQQKRMFDK